MIGYETSFVRLFTPEEGQPRISRIEIPIFQRDYAQGREGRKVSRIRSDFLEAIRGALLGRRRLALDFVYGDISEGVLRPLDGQQRLTTLFLLHWYIASRRGQLNEHPGWKAFAYETRPSAREFCEALTDSGVEGRSGPLSTWLRDRPWFRYTWDNDPTIRAMLRMLDEIDTRFDAVDPDVAWDRLIDIEHPAISFHLLPVQDLRSAEQLYIKMNSRGRPLTEFETFKARIEQILESSAPSMAREFADKVDGVWMDVLWRYRGDDSAIDDEFQRYFQFIIEACEWRDGSSQEGGLTTRAARAFGAGNPRAHENLRFLFAAFDTWVGVDVRAWFSSVFSSSPGSVSMVPPQAVVLFEGEVNLFAACCGSYGVPRGKGREFTYQQTLLLYGSLLARMHGSDDLKPRLRVLRNLVAGSANEVRQEQMSLLISAVECLMVDGRLDAGGVAAFSSAQLEDERRKGDCLAKHPELTAPVQHLEDHELLQGRLSAFDLEAESFPRRAAAFHRLFEDPSRWSAITGALLAYGDYSRWKRVNTSFQLGSSKNAAPWRAVFAQAAYADAANTRAALEQLLDELVGISGSIDACLATVQAQWVAECERTGELGWRYYLVKYPVMRQGLSGLYIDRASPDGFTMCMLDYVTRRGWHRDPYLSAVREASGAPERFLDPKFLGYEADTKGLVFERSNVRLTSAVSGFNVSAPSLPEHSAPFEEVCRRHGIMSGVLTIPQVRSGGFLCDKTDRVQRATAFARDLLEVGL
jgi:hypothetical protein